MSFDPLSALFDLGKVAIEKIWPDPSARAAQLLELEKLKQNGDLAQLNAHVQLMLGQIEINKVEAASSDRFVSGARPFIMWVCGVSLGYSFLVEPFMRFIAQVAFKYTGSFPVLQMDELTTILMGLLGLGAMRTIEKLKDKA